MPQPDSPLTPEPAMPSIESLARLRAKVLEPADALHLVGDRPRRTAYLPQRLLVDASRVDEVLPLIEKAAAEHGWQPEREQRERRHPWSPSVRAIEFVATTAAHQAPDAWPILQLATVMAGGKLPGVGLDHVMHPSRLPFTDSSPVAGAGYGHPGGGGLQPVAFVGPRPTKPTPMSNRLLKRKSGRRPVVAIVDTGCDNTHPWLDGFVECGVEVNGEVPGVTDPATDPELHPSQFEAINGLRDRYAGHGTFIAGLVHQTCPDAQILSWRVVPSDGPVPESELIEVLDALATLVEQHRDGVEGGRPIDVLSLSLGYYPETDPASADYDALITRPLDRLIACGTIVVCAAGNDATSRPRMPAALAARAVTSGSDPMVVSVGALNVDRTTDTLFSNAGDWVIAHRVGASLLSTLPPFATGEEPVSRADFSGRRRAGHDPDRFAVPGSGDRLAGGFGLWSGTSFAAPVLAGEIAAKLVEIGLSGGPEADDLRRQRAGRVLADLGLPER